MTSHITTMLAAITLLATIVPGAFAGGATSVYDFVKRFPDAKVTNAMSPGIVRGESAGVMKPAIFLHPSLPGETTAEYAVELPKLKSGEKLLAVYSAGLRDGIRMNDAASPFDGVTFALKINGKTEFEANLKDFGWIDAATDLTSQAGKKVKVTFVTRGNKNTNYDWALWGAPHIFRLSTSILEGTTAPAAKGIVTVRPAKDAVLTVSPVGGSGGQPITANLRKGRLSAVRFDYMASGANSVKVEYAGSPKDLAVYAFAPELRIVSFGPTSAVVYQGKPCMLRVVVENIGEGALEKSDDASVTVGLSADGSPVKGYGSLSSVQRLPVGPLLPGKSQAIEFEFAAPANTPEMRLGAVITVADSPEVVADRTVPVVSPSAVADAPGGTVTAEKLADGSVVLRNARIRMHMLRSTSGFAAWTMSVPRDGEWQQVSSGSFGTLTALSEGRPVESRLYPTDAKLSNDSVTLSLNGTAGASPCTFEWVFRLDAEKPRVSVRHSVTAQQPADILHFSGPTVYAGDGAFGAKKDEALFPGLEYLLTEDSSGTEFVSPPNNLRTVPHPNKVTIPFMAVRHGGTLVMLEWDPLQRWDGKADRPSPIFASRNFLDGQDNHLMGIFAPSVPDWTPENKTTAEKPYALAAGQSIRLDAVITAMADSTTIIDAVDDWIARHGFPEPPKMTRKPSEMMDLCDQSFLGSSWDAGAKAWKHTITGPTTFDAMIANYLWARTHRVAKKDVILAIEDVVRPATDAAKASLPLSTSLFVGDPESALDRAFAHADSLIKSQRDDGSWPFIPSDKKHEVFGRTGDTSSGWTAIRAQDLLEHALITSDARAKEAGIKALKFLDTTTRPEGAQTWELQLHVPDILASARLVRAYLAGYRLTDDKHYLDRAVYWAKTGLPFVYLWNAKDQPIMRYGTIPVFGATWFDGQPWFGVMVQWCGLEYGYAIDKLADFDQSLPWKQISKGILNCGIQQQEYTTREYPENAGMYPDAYSPIKGKEEYHWDLNPRLIARNILRDLGADGEPTTFTVRDKHSQLLTLTLPVQNLKMVYDDEWVNIQFNYSPGKTIYGVVSGIYHPETFDLNGEVVRLCSDLGTVVQGWKLDKERMIALLKLRPAATNRLVIDLIQHEMHATQQASKNAPDQQSEQAPTPDKE